MPEYRASGTLTSTGEVVDGETVTIGSHVYTFKTVLTGAPDEILIGVEAESVPNLAAAVAGSAGAGTTYGTGTVAHADVDVVSSDATTLDIRAKVGGTAGNSIATTETSDELSWAAVTLLGGTASPNPSFPDAINAMLIANPTGADVTVNAKTALKNAVSLVLIDDATPTEFNGFLVAGCAILRNSVGTESGRQQAGYLLHMEQYQG